MVALDHEQFQGAKELAEIGTKIAAGIAALAQLKADEENYLTDRETKLVARLQQALTDSGDLIKAIGNNHGALVGYRKEVEDFYTRVLSLLQSVMVCHDLLDSASEALDARITDHEEAASAMKQENANAKVLIDGEREGLSAWRDRLTLDEARIKDRTALLERTVKRVKKQ